MRRFLGLLGLGAALTYFLDPDQGVRRRNMARDRLLGFLRRRARRGQQVGQGAASEAQAVTQKATHLKEEPKAFDDVTLARKVETELFRRTGHACAR